MSDAHTENTFPIATRAKQLSGCLRSAIEVLAVENPDGLYARGLNKEYGLSLAHINKLIGIANYFRIVAGELRVVGHNELAKKFDAIADEVCYKDDELEELPYDNK